MTKREALAYFKANILPGVDQKYPPDHRGRPDVSARREAWNEYTDGLCKDGEITRHQDETWSNPF